MITPDRLATIRRAARHAVGKYDLVWVAIGRENSSTSSSTRGRVGERGGGVVRAAGHESSEPVAPAGVELLERPCFVARSPVDCRVAASVPERPADGVRTRSELLEVELDARG
jgi:hypothetical protein